MQRLHPVGVKAAVYIMIHRASLICIAVDKLGVMYMSMKINIYRIRLKHHGLVRKYEVVVYYRREFPHSLEGKLGKFLYRRLSMIISPVVVSKKCIHTISLPA